MAEDRRAHIVDGRTVLGIELGSTRIKACLIDQDHVTIATGSHEWDNDIVDGRWTYTLDAVADGIRAAYTALLGEIESLYRVRPTTYQAIGVSAMMHGYLAFGADGTLLVPFRTWRNTSTGPAAARLSAALDCNIPLRWSIAHLYQAVLDDEPHVRRIARLTTLAGYVHGQLTGRNVLGIGDASGMFPIDPAARDYDVHRLAEAERLIGLGSLRRILPEVLVAGQDAGTLTAEGAASLDPTGMLQPGIPLCPPEGDAGTGMVATNSVAPHAGNVSVGTSIFAMVVLEHPLNAPHQELDIVSTPSGDAVAMVHCNNGADEIAAWARVFKQFATAAGLPVDTDTVYRIMFAAAADAGPDAGGLLAWNYRSGEPIAGVADGRPILLRTPAAEFTFSTLVRAELHGVFATLALGMAVLRSEGVVIDRMTAHGGLFRTSGVPERLLAAALRAPVAIEATAEDGGAWGIAVLASYLGHADVPLGAFLADSVFAHGQAHVSEPDMRDADGFTRYLDRFRAAMPIQAVAATTTEEGIR